MNEQIIKLAALIKQSNKTVFFGGAGVSTESGVKDYRSKDGLYNTVKEYGVSPETILSHTFLFSKPDIFYSFNYKYFLENDVKPNKAHISLALLEKNGLLSSVITQNIDNLHFDAGSKNVLELHGNANRYYCSKCRRPYFKKDVKALSGKAPYCKFCGSLIRPDVVLYEEPLDTVVTRKAISEIENADLLIIGGTSLAVYPAAGYLQYFSGKNIVLINRDETHYDNKASLIIRENIGEVLNAVITELNI